MPRFECPSCGAEISVSDADPGDEVSCRECGKRTVVPEPKRSKHYRDSESNVEDVEHDERQPDQPAQKWLILGMAVGMGIVVVQTISSERLRRRDDVTRAMGVPVKLSVGPVRLSRWRPGRHGLAAADHPAVRRITAYLRHPDHRRPHLGGIEIES